MYCGILVNKLRKMSVKGRLRGGLRSRDLDFMAECLKTLLFPEYYDAFKDAGKL